jgi:hypothetical protein
MCRTEESALVPQGVSVAIDIQKAQVPLLKPAHPTHFFKLRELPELI